MQKRNQSNAWRALRLMAGVLLIGSTALPMVASATSLPSFKVVASPGLVTPTTADTYYCNVGCTASGTVDLWAAAGPPVEITALANSLHRDPDLIYEYVRNNIDTVFMYGVQKGALGAIIDQSGTAFDQAELMVMLLRAAGYPANYQAGTITLTGAQMQAWIGVTDAASLTKILADGGIPATVTPTTGTVTSVTLSHVWVQATIAGSNYLFDPAYKPYTITAPVNLGSAMGWSQSGFQSVATGSATTGTSYDGSGTVAAPWIQHVNNAGIQAQMTTYANSLVAYIKTSYGDKQIDDLVGRHDIQQYVKPVGGLRQTALPYSSTVQHTWTNNVPDVYRTTMTLDLVYGSQSQVRQLFVDELYGRRVAYDTTQDASFYYRYTTLTVDRQAVAPSMYQVSQLQSSTLAISVNHPYAAAARPSSQNTSPAAGTYMDQTEALGNTPVSSVYFASSVIVVAGFGDTSSNLLSRLSSEETKDAIAVAQWTTPTSCNKSENSLICSTPDGQHPSESDYTYAKIGADWLAQNTRQIQLQSRIGTGVVQQHHHVGVIANNDPFVGAANAYLSIDSSVSINSKTGDANGRSALNQSLAAFSDALEGSVFGQQMDSFDAQSISSRFGWSQENTFGQSTKFYLFSQNANNNVDYSALLPSSADSLASGGTIWPTVQQYLQDTSLSGTANAAHYQLLAADNSFLGPGAQCFAGVQTKCAMYDTTRGGAFLAFGTDGASYSVANVNVNLNSAPNAKGGGAASAPAMSGDYDPTGASQLLKDKFKDVTKQFGVDLKSGDLTYSAPADLTVGNGGAPYALGLQRSFRQGGAHTPGLGWGWTHNWDIRLQVGSSGMATMGDGPAVQSAGSLASFYVTQQLFYFQPASQSALLAQWVAAPFVEYWWTQQIAHNTVTRTVGASSEQFVRLPYNSTNSSTPVDPTTFVFNPPHGFIPSDGSSYEKLIQTGLPIPNRDSNNEPTGTWSMSGVAFALTSPQKDVQQFGFWVSRITNKNLNADASTYGGSHGWHIQSWTFPTSVSLSFAYAPDGGNSGDIHDDHLLSVSSSVGHSLTFTYSDPGIMRPDSSFCYLSSVTDETGRGATFGCTGPGSTLSSVTSPSGDVSKYVYDSRTYSVNTTGPYPACTAPTGSRPQCYPVLTQVYTPSDSSYPKLLFGYDATWRVTSFQDAVSIKTPSQRGAYQFFITGNTRGERMDPAGYSYTSYYDKWGRSVETIDELGRISTATYDGIDRVLTRTAPLGNMTAFQYDPKGNVLALTETPYATAFTQPTSIGLSASYDINCNKIRTVTDANGNVTTWTYDPSTCLLSNVSQPAVFDGASQTTKNPVTTYTYNTVGLKAQVTDPSGLLVKYTYDTTYNVNVTMREIDPSNLDLKTQYAYDNGSTGVGNITSVTDGNNNVTTYAYDSDRRVLEVDAPTSTCIKTKNIYTGGLVTQVQRNTANPCSTPTWTTAASTVYTATDKPYQVTDASGYVSETDYDLDDRTVDSIQYLAAGNTGAKRDTHTVYDAAGQVLNVYKGWGTDDQIKYASYSYSSDGQVLTTADANGNTTINAYDGYDRLAKMTMPDSTYELYGYDSNSNPTSRTNRDGKVISFTPDALNREITRTVPANAAGNYARTLSTVYDLASRKWTLTADGQTLSFGYDTAKRSTSVNDSLLNALPASNVTGNINYTYDGNSNKSTYTFFGTGLTYTPNSVTVQYLYDAAERLYNINLSGYANFNFAVYTFDTLSRKTATTFLDGTTASYSYQANDDLASLTHTWTGGSLSYGFTFNGAHQLVGQTISDNTYESTAGTASSSYAVNNLNQYTQAAGATLSYDSDGNMLSDGTYIYTYDEENRLRTASGAGHSSTYMYDPIGRRRSKTVDGTITYYTYDGVDEVAEWDGNGNRLHVKTPGGGTDDVNSWWDEASGVWINNHSDRQGSAVVMTSAPSYGALASSYHYGPYGESTDATTGNPYRYTGQYLDAETGLYYYKARYYSPKIGRFLQTDPIGGSDDLNQYAYTGGDPLNHADPMGQATCSVNGGDSTDCNNVQLSDLKTGDTVKVMLDSGTSFNVSGSLATGLSFVPVVGALPSLQDLHAAAENGDVPGMVTAAGNAVLGMVAGKEGQLEGKAAAKGLEEGIEAAEKLADKIKGYTSHGVDRAIGDGGSRAGTKPQAILDAIRNPKKVTEGVDSQGRPFKVYMGKDARVVVNPATGKIVSTNPLSGSGVR